MYKYLYVWHNLNNNSYYYKLLNHDNSDYYIGYINQYNHKLLIKDKLVIDKYVSFSPYELKKRAVKNIINFLEKNI